MLMGNFQRLFKAVPRQKFMPEELRPMADVDTALPIGFGQTISQPSTVERMLDWLDVESGDKVLDIGSGSGWTSALLAKLVGPKGRVIAVELIPELVAFGRQNCQNLDLANIEFHQSGPTLGWPAQAPYDRILVSAAADDIPPELIDQLGPTAKMVIPVRHDILEIEKNNGDDIQVVKHEGYIFVPLIQP